MVGMDRPPGAVRPFALAVVRLSFPVSSVRSGITVSHSADGLDHLGLRSISLDLLPQAGDANVNASVKRVPPAVVGKFEQLVAIKCSSAMLGEHFQELELHRRDRNLHSLCIEQFVCAREEAAIAEFDRAAP